MVQILIMLKLDIALVKAHRDESDDTFSNTAAPYTLLCKCDLYYSPNGNKGSKPTAYKSKD